MIPKLKFYNHVVALSEAELQQLVDWANQSVAFCLDNPAPQGSQNLPALSEVEISIVNDEVIGQVHDEFFNDPDPTDVITFQHGEILVSYDTAKRSSQEYSHSSLKELFLYVVHGLLHLNGHLDDEVELRNVMHQIQNRIWAEVCGG